MKGLLVGIAGFMLVTAAFTTPGSAGEVFEVDLIPCGTPGTTTECGNATPANHPLKRGQVTVKRDGDVIVELKGAQPLTTYMMFEGTFRSVIIDGQFESRFPVLGTPVGIGTVTTNRRGNFKGHVTTDTGGRFAFPVGTTISQPCFAFNPGPPFNVTTAYICGFEIKAKTHDEDDD